MDITKKLHILADAAKYDASCASSGSKKTRTGKGLGSTEGMGIVIAIRLMVDVFLYLKYYLLIFAFSIANIASTVLRVIYHVLNFQLQK